MKALILGNVWPEPLSSAAGARIMQLLYGLQKAGFEVHFACAAGKTPHSENLEVLGVSVQEIKLNDVSFDSFLKDLDPQLVLFDKFVVEEQYGWRVKEACPQAIRILETIDLHGLRKGREAALKDNAEFANAYLHNDFAKRELASIYRCDLTLVISKFEFDLLQGFFKVESSLLLYLPFMVEALREEDVKSWKSFKERKHFVTIGNFRHEPNWLSVRYLKTEIWPLIRKQLPEAEMHVYGAYPAEKHTQLHNPKDKFFILGRAESAHEVIGNSRVLLAPLLTGAGLKGKLLDAMQTGTPAVTTNVGAEGMHGDLAFNGSVSNTPEEFANAAVDLYSNPESWQEAQTNGIEIINTRFQADFWQPVFTERLKHLKENLAVHRLHNFTGSMLWHQSLQASKFMSRWIELKNK